VVSLSPRGRKEFFLHELFHGVQPRLGLTVQALATEHLDAVDGRYWLRLEWRALARALRESGEESDRAARQALAFRRPGAYSTQPVSKASAPPRTREGLAHYTGTVVAGSNTGVSCTHIRSIARRGCPGVMQVSDTFGGWLCAVARTPVNELSVHGAA
jgi:hypothetical protein